MKSIRIGNDINIVWAIYDVTGAPYELKKEMKLTLKCGNYLYEIENYTVEDNKIMFTFYGKTQTTVGTYMLTLVENDDEVGMQTVDCCKAFKLVRTSCEQTDDDTLNPQVDTLQLTSNIDFYGVMGGNAEPEFIEFADLIAKAERGELEVGKEYRYPYTLVVLDNDEEYFSYKSAGHYFDIVTRALTPSILCEKVRIMYNENDSYFKDWNANVGAWQVWINMQRPTQVDICYMPSNEDFINTKGQIYKMIDENGIECNYDFKNMLFKCCVGDGFIGNDAETEFRATIPYNNASTWGEESEPLYLYTFSTYIGDENWKDNIVDASLFDRKYSREGSKMFYNIKITLYFVDEGSVCIIKVLNYMDEDGNVYIINYVENLNISNGLAADICCFGSLHNVNIIDSDRVYLSDCDNCDINNTNCVLSATQNSKVIGGFAIGLGECYNCEIKDSSHIYLFDSVDSKFDSVQGHEGELDFPDNFLRYIMEFGDWNNVNDARDCDLKDVLLDTIFSSSGIKIHNVTSKNNSVVYLGINDCINIEINNLNLYYDGQNESVLQITECNHMIFGNYNNLYLGEESTIFNCSNVSVGNDNSILLNIETERENMFDIHNISNITIGNNNNSVFINNCYNINIGDDNGDIYIAGRRVRGIENVTVKNNSDVYLSDLDNDGRHVVNVKNIVVENNCYLQLCYTEDYLVENGADDASLSNIHIKNGGRFNMFSNSQEQYYIREIDNIEVDGSIIDNILIRNGIVKDIKFINCNINNIDFNGNNDTIKNIVFKDCEISSRIYVEGVTTQGLYTVTIESSDVLLNDLLLNRYPIQYIVGGKTYAMTEIL